MKADDTGKRKADSKLEPTGRKRPRNSTQHIEVDVALIEKAVKELSKSHYPHTIIHRGSTNFSPRRRKNGNWAEAVTDRVVPEYAISNPRSYRNELKQQFLRHLTTTLFRMSKGHSASNAVEMQIALVNSKLLIAANSDAAVRDVQTYIDGLGTSFFQAVLDFIDNDLRSKPSIRADRHMQKLRTSIEGSRREGRHSKHMHRRIHGLDEATLQAMRDSRFSEITSNISLSSESAGSQVNRFLSSNSGHMICIIGGGVAGSPIHLSKPGTRSGRTGSATVAPGDSGGRSHRGSPVNNVGSIHAEQKILLALVKANSVSPLRAIVHDEIVMQGTKRPCAICHMTLQLVQKHLLPGLKFESRPGTMFQTSAAGYAAVLEAIMHSPGDRILCSDSLPDPAHPLPSDIAQAMKAAKDHPDKIPPQSIRSHITRPRPGSMQAPGSTGADAGQALETGHGSDSDSDVG